MLLRRSILSLGARAAALTSSSTQPSVWSSLAVPEAHGAAALASPAFARLTMAPRAQTRSIAASATLSADLQQALKPKMMCMQCEQTANQTGCTVVGQCGKSPEVAGLQDLLIHSLKGLATLADHARAVGNISDPEVDSFMLRATFSTLTNVNFDDARFEEYINHCVRLHARLADKVKAAGKSLPQAPALASTPWFEPATGHPLSWNAALATSNTQLDMAELLDISKRTGILTRQEVLGKTVAGLQELVVYGIKGVCAYAAHAEALGAKDDQVYADVHRAMAFLGTPDAKDPNKLLELSLAVGKTNFRVMQMLSEAHSNTFGHPEPTEVTLVPRNGKCILVTGHDMHDLHMLLQQIDAMGADIDVYTHGEMLPAHGYPGLRKYKHLAGHYGGAWYQQKKDFVGFPGAILATTNCVMEPMALYRKNLFTTNETGLANVGHVASKDFSAVIQRALELPGWTDRNKPRTVLQGANSAGRGGATAATQPQKTAVTVGFGHHAVLGVADKVIGAINEGKLKHIFLVGGCDGHEPQRAYYAGLGNHLPKETMLLTLGCGKFRLIDQEFGSLGDTGLPRLLDMGQCNDAYSALVVATELAKAFKTDVNSLPLSLDLSWLEQKAVAVLLTLLHLGVKNIRLGPTMPAFLTPDAVAILVEKFALKPADTTHPDLDLKAMMARA